MATSATKPPPRSSAQHSHAGGKRLLEISSGFERVDAEAGIIYGVKIVGLESRNIGRTIGLDPKVFNGALDKTYGYSKQALESAIPMYEGSSVRTNHPKSEIDANGRRIVKVVSRDFNETFGELRNVKMKEDGLYGDLHYIKSHADAAYVAETAQKMPDKLALSHNAYGVPVLRNGRAVIEQILQVYSVDIVGDKPGTTNGLFESYSEDIPVAKKKIKAIFESLAVTTALAIAGRARLLEMCDEELGGAKVAEMEVDAPAEMSTDDQAKAAFRAMVVAAFDDEKLDTKATMAKIKAIMDAQDKLAGKAESAETPAAKGAETSESHADESELAKRLRLLETENQEMKADKAARGLLESCGREITPVRLNAVKALASDTDRKALIETWPKQETDIFAGRPRQSAPLLESQAGEKALTGAELITALKR